MSIFRRIAWPEIFAISDIHIVPAHFLFLTLLLYFMQKFSFQAMENARFKIAADRTAADTEDPDHWDKLPRNTRLAAATGKASLPRHFAQEWSEDTLTYALPFTDLAYAFPMPSLAIPDEMVIDATPLNQRPPPAGVRVGKKRGVKPQPDTSQQHKRQKVGAPNPKKPRPVASG
jgi:hypothetical protein